MRFWGREMGIKTKLVILLLAVVLVLGGTTSKTIAEEESVPPDTGEQTAPAPKASAGQTERVSVPSTFTTSWREGGLNTSTPKEGIITGNLLDITPRNNYSTRPAIYQLDFTMGGDRDAAPGEIEIRIPAHIFYGRDGKPVDTISVPLPKAPDIVGTTSFNYWEDKETGEIVITNYEEFTRTASFSLFIEHDFWPYQVKDGFTHPEIRAKVNIKTDGGSITAETDPLLVKVNTTAKLTEVRKAIEKRTNVWNPLWGPLPEDADKYFYCLWRVNLKSNSTATQPFEVKMTDIGVPSGDVVAFSMPKVLHILNTPALGYIPNTKYPDGTDTFSNYVFQKTDDPKDNNSTEWRTFYVVTKYDKSLAVPNTVLKNTVTANLTGVDGAKDTLSKTDTYTYKPDAVYEGDYSSAYKATASSVRKDGVLNALDNGESASPIGVGNYSFKLVANFTGKDASQDGEKDYTVELVDGLMGMRQDVEKDKKPWFDLLKAGTDYEYTNAYVLYNEYDYTYSESGGYIKNLSTNYSNYKPVEIYVQKNNDPQWIRYGEIIKTGGYDTSYYFTPTGGGSRVNITPNLPLKLPAGTTNLKYQYTGNKFAVDFDARFSIKIHSTAAVKSAIEKARANGEETLQFYNIFTYGVKNSEGEYINATDKLQVNSDDKFYLPEDVWDALRQQDTEMTGTDNQHLRHAGSGIQLKEAVAHSNLIKWNKPPVSDVNNGRSVVPYSIYMSESTSLNSNVISRENALKWEIVSPQNTGVFYDLLPKGTWAQKDSIKVYTVNVSSNGYGYDYVRGKPCAFDVSFIPDWKDSGMTMMKISVQSPVDPNIFIATGSSGDYNIYSGFIVDFDVINPWDNILDHGRSMLNSVAYQTGKGVLANGLPDEGGKIDEKQWYQDVNGDNDPNDRQFLYAQNKVDATPLLATEIGTTKMVKSMEQATFGILSEVPVGGEYIYRMRYSVAKNTQARNVILYDVLENAYGEEPYWQGTFNRVDVEKAVEKGIDPVVYYSTRNDLNPRNNPSDGDLTNGDIWTKEEPADKTTIKAIAVDLSKTPNGQDYIFPGESILPIFIYMDAPKNGVPYMNPTVYAWNDSYIHAIKMMPTGEDVVVNEKTPAVKVYLREVTLGIEKSSVPESGTFDSPADLRENGNKVEYTLKIKDSSASEVAQNIEVVDHIPDGLKVETGDIRYKLNGGAENEITAGGPITLVRDEQKLTFSIKKLSPGDEMEIILPAQVVKPEMLNQNVPIYQNTAEITKVAGREYGVRSNTVYHKTEFPTERTVKKVWDDSSDANGQRPDSVTVKLLADGKPYGDGVKLSEENGWKHTWEDLPFSSAEGNKVKYTLEEEAVDGYTAEIKETYDPDTGETGFEVVNSMETTTRTVTKYWSDRDNILNIRPDHVEVQLLANGKPYGEPVTLNKSNNWTHQWEGLPLMKNGESVEYNVSEEAEKPYRNKVYQFEDEKTGEVSFAISNSLDLEDKTVIKIWEDEDDKYGKRPESITVQLYRDGEAFGDPVTLSADTGWFYTWENLIIDTSGEMYKYTVKEVLVEGYTGEVENVEREDGEVVGFLITNSYNKPPEPPETISVTGRKVWMGGPEEKPEIQLQLMQNGEPFGEPVAFPMGTTSYTWKDLEAKDGDGKPYVYTVDEVAVPEGYTAKKMSEGLTIVNVWDKPTTPEDPLGTPGEPGHVKVMPDKPKTGDETHAGLLLGLLLTSALLLTGLTIRRGKENK